MLLCFELSMPNRGSWNGGWSGDGRIHARIVNLGYSKKAEEEGRRIVEGSPYFYAWSDGWSASVSVRIVDGNEARRIRRQSAGFAGYDWMINSIRRHGDIRVTTRT